MDSNVTAAQENTEHATDNLEKVKHRVNVGYIEERSRRNCMCKHVTLMPLKDE